MPTSFANSPRQGVLAKQKTAKLKSSITKLSQDLTKCLLNRAADSSATADLLASIRKHIQGIHQQPPPRAGLYGDKDLDQLSTTLWNTCTHARSEVAGKEATALNRRLVLSSRVFAFQIIHLVQWGEKIPATALAYLMRLAVKAGKSSIDEQDSELAKVVMQQMAEYDTQAEKAQQENIEEDGVQECLQLRAEYYGVRAAMCWKEERLEVAEHMYTKMEALLPYLDHRSAENLAEVLFEIGRSLAVAKHDYAMGIKWLGRSNDIITSQTLGQLSPEGIQLRLAIFQAHITALLGLGTAESLERARSLVGYIESEIGNKPFVLILKLELLSNSPAETFDGEAYSDVLRRMIKSFKYTDPNFNALRKHIQKLREKSPTLGAKVLDEFLVNLHNGGFEQGKSVDWYEKLVVLRVKITTQYRESLKSIEQARSLFSELERPLGSQGAVGCLTIIWKTLNGSFSQERYDLAKAWCHLALIPIFENSGPVNRAKVERKLLLCSVSLNDLPLAMSTYHAMSEQTQYDEKTSYLMFKVAARNGDLELATQCLERVGSSKKNENIMYACVLDAQKTGDQACVVEALRKLVQGYKHRPNGPIHFPALLRCTIRFLHILDRKDASPDSKREIVSNIAATFEQAARGIERNECDANGNKIFNTQELEWFCQNAYSLAIKNSQDWEPRELVQILDACLVIIDRFPDDATSLVAGDLPLRKLFCHFINASALTALARGQDEVEKQLSDYHAARKNVSGFECALETCRGTLKLPASQYKQLLKKLQIIIIFDFEAAMNLRQFGDLGEIVRRAVVCENSGPFKAMADCVLRLQGSLQMPPQDFYSAMNAIIYELSNLSDRDNVRLARYTRCLFQATMGLDPDLAYGELRAACDMAKRAANDMGSSWPQDELEWIATVAYNHGLDCSGVGDEDRAHRWIQMAMNLAHYNGDGGQLEKIMQENYTSMQLSRERGGRSTSRSAS